MGLHPANFFLNENERTLTISERKGEFSGILKNRTFSVIIVKENHGTGEGITDAPDKEVVYNREQQAINFR